MSSRLQIECSWYLSESPRHPPGYMYIIPPALSSWIFMTGFFLQTKRTRGHLLLFLPQSLPPAAPAYSLCTQVQTLGGPTWCGMSSPGCEYLRLIHCRQPHLRSVGCCVCGSFLIFKMDWTEDGQNSMAFALMILPVLLNCEGQKAHFSGSLHASS